MEQYTTEIVYNGNATTIDNDSSVRLCLMSFDCGHYCYEPVHHTVGFSHGPCLTVLEVELRCGHIGLMHCYQNLKKLKCDTCGRDQPIQRIFEYFKSHNNYIHPGLRDERKEDGHTVAFFPRVAEDNSVGAETDENETVDLAVKNEMMDIADAAAAIDDYNKFPAQPDGNDSFVNLTSQNQPVNLIGLGKRRQDGDDGAKAEDYDYKRDETNEPPTKKCGLFKITKSNGEN